MEDVPTTEGSVMTEGVGRAEGDLGATDSRLPSLELLSKLAGELQDLDSSSEMDLVDICSTFRTLYGTIALVSKDFVKAVREKDWKDVVSHGTHLALRWTSL
jgi:hypothetical protein